MDNADLRQQLASNHSASFAWAVACCRSRDEAEEVLQSVYARVLAGRAPFTGEAAFRTWLFAVIRNAASDARRRNWWSRVLRLDFPTFAELSEHAVKQQVEHDDELHRIRQAIAALPERQRQLTHLVFYEDLTIAESAEILGVSVGAARQHYARAKDRLRAALQSIQAPVDEPVQK